MDSGSRSSGGAGFDDDDGLTARREVSSSLKELTLRSERKSKWGREESARAHGDGHGLAVRAAIPRPPAPRPPRSLRPPPQQLVSHCARAAARRLPCRRVPLPRPRTTCSTTSPTRHRTSSTQPRASPCPRRRAAHAHAEFTRFLDNTLTVMYFACGAARRARIVFEGMRDGDVISWTSLISGLVQNGSPLQGLHLFAAMMCCEVRPDFVLLVTVLKAYMKLDDLQGAKSAHSLAIKGRFDNELDVLITLTVMYAKFGPIVAARALFDRVPPPQVNVILWNAMLSGYSKNGLASEAVHLFKHMQMVARSMTPEALSTLVTLRSVILARAQLGSTELAAWMEDYVCRSEYREDVLVNTALIDMYAKSGSIAHACAIFERMHTQERDVVVWSALITGYGVHGHVTEAVALFKDVKLAGVKPNDVTFLGLLSACNHTGAVEKGWSYFHSMKLDYNIEPQHQHYACVVDLLARAGQLDRAYRFVLGMPIRPEMIVWGALFRGCKMDGHSNMAMAECAAQHIFE